MQRGTPSFADLCLGLDKYGYWAPPEKLGLGKDVLPVLFRSPSQKVLSFTLEEAKKLLEERSKQKPGPNMNAASKARYDGQLQEITTLVEKLEDPKYPVQQLGSILYSGGLNRKHCEGGRLDVAGGLLEGTVLINSSNDVSDLPLRFIFLQDVLTRDRSVTRLTVGPTCMRHQVIVSQRLMTHLGRTGRTKKRTRRTPTQSGKSTRLEQSLDVHTVLSVQESVPMLSL